MNIILEKLRDEKGLLKKEVAEEMKVVNSVYSEWENEKLTIPTRRLYQLANFYEVNIDYIVGLTDKRVRLKNYKNINTDLVAIRLKEVRKSLKLSMRELAQKLNTSSSAISNYENNKYLILSPFLIELCRISNISVDWVLGRTDKKHIHQKKELMALK